MVLTRTRVGVAASVAVAAVALVDGDFAHFLAVYGRWWLTLGD